MRLLSPTELEILYVRKERLLIAFLAKNSTWLTVVGAGALLTVLLYLTTNRVDTSPPEDLLLGGYITFRLIRYGLLLALPLSILYLVVPSRGRTPFLLLSLSAMWMTSCAMFFDRIDQPLVKFYCFIFQPLLCVGSFIFLRHSARAIRIWPGALLFSLFYLGMITTAAFGLWTFSAEFETFFKLRTHIVFIGVLALAFSRRLRPRDAQFAFLPFHGLRGSFWPGDNPWKIDEDRVHLWWHGALNFTVGLLALHLRIGMDQFYDNSFATPFHAAVARYSLIPFSEIAIYNFVAGSARIFGFRVPDATYFVFLSRTPAEFWRRGSVFTYDFIHRYVYLPMYRRVTRNLFVVTFVSFFIFFVNHQGISGLFKSMLYWSGYGAPLTGKETEQLYYSTTVFLLMFILIYITRRKWFFTFLPKRNDNLNWISVLMTHLLMVLTFFLAHLLVKTFGGEG